MKYPLSTLQFAAREIVCMVEGHKWKSSIRWKKNRDELSELDFEGKLPYMKTDIGNPYMEQGAWWRYKCIRCRLTSREDWQPLQVQFVRAIHQVVWQVKSTFNVLFMEKDDETLLWKRLLIVIPLLVVNAVQGFVVQFDHAPGFLLDITSSLGYVMFCWLEPKEKEGQPSGVAN